MTKWFDDMELICEMREVVSKFFFGGFRAQVQDVPLPDLKEMYDQIREER